MSKRPFNPRIVALLAVAAVVAIACVLGLQRQGQRTEQVQETTASPDPYASIDFDDPVASYQMLRFVVERGGDKYQRQLAIDWLDEQARMGLAPDAEQEHWLLTMIENGGHPDWDIETQLWLFNNVFDYLHLGKEHERLTDHLLQLAVDHPHKTMRLYALQHIGVQRSVGNLDGAIAGKTRATLLRLANEDDGEVAGAALVAAVEWDGLETPPSREFVELALELAADPGCAVDVRVTAIHAVGNETLPLARALASDTEQPVHVRKAAIACIGKYGTNEDTAPLRQLAKENFRIAQAAEPALEAIRHRESGGATRDAVPL